ncbi:MAG: MarR family transcriptional regulator [Bacteroidota bacterium]|nr:MarR family transcriptional regulator [Bacteroidota bacterium]
MKKRMDMEKQDFIEEMARTCEQSFGLPRMGGRIWGTLLLTEEEYLSSEDLMELINTSRGSVSTMVRLLERVGLIKRVSIPGDRRHYYTAAGAESLMHAELASLKMFIDLMERGKRSLSARDRMGGERLEEIRDLMVFFEKEYAALMNRWHKRKAKK